MAMEEGDEDMYGEEEIDFSAVTGPVVYTRSHIVGTPEGREYCLPSPLRHHSMSKLMLQASP